MNDPQKLNRLSPPDPRPIGPDLLTVLTVPKVGRNDPCPCGSGQKYKRCCLKARQDARRRLETRSYDDD